MTRREARQGLFHSFESFYDRQRGNSLIGYRSPAAFGQAHAQQLCTAWCPPERGNLNLRKEETKSGVDTTRQDVHTSQMDIPMSSTTGVPPTIIVRSPRGLVSLGLRDVWAYRELLYFLVWRNVKVRCRQTLLGVLWVVPQPVVSMAIFTVLFGMLLDVDSSNVPNPVFALAGHLPWKSFSQALTRSSISVINSSCLVTKNYSMRLVTGLIGWLASLVASAITSGMAFRSMVNDTVC